MAANHRYFINMDLLPIKGHYFFFCAAMGGTLPYMPVLGKELGISATAVGITYTVLPFLIFLSKIFFGFLTDHLRNIRAVMVALLITTGICSVLLLLIPSIPAHIYLHCSEMNKTMLLPIQLHKNCYEQNGLQLAFNDTICSASENCDEDCHKTTANITAKLSDGRIVFREIAINTSSNQQLLISMMNNSEISSLCDCIRDNPSTLSLLDSCGQETSIEEPISEYKTYTFWLFTLLNVVSGIGCAAATSISDAACYEVLGDKSSLYGRQRLWGTLGWGVTTLLAGFLNDLFTNDPHHPNYAPGFYLTAGLLVIDLLILMRIRLVKANMSSNICKDTGTIFSSPQMIVFAIAVFAMGAVAGLFWRYYFWFLQDMGASQTLLGLAVLIMCVIGETPLFFYSGWFLKKLGHFHCVSISFAAYALRFGCLYLLKNPWFVLPIDVLHGLTFALFYASMTSYASKMAPAGTEATILGLLGGLHEGLGGAVGSLLGGISFDELGGRNTFLLAGIVSLVCSIPLSIVNLCQRTVKKGSANLHHLKAESEGKTAF